MKARVLFVLLITTSFIYACSGIKLQNYPSQSISLPPARRPCAQLPGNATVSVIKDRCSLCHKGDFKTKESICARKSIIIDSVSKGRMPKFGKLKESELKTILKWEL